MVMKHISGAVDRGFSNVISVDKRVKVYHSQVNTRLKQST